jgi:hypothetical protein
MGFAWKHDPGLNPPLNFLPARFMNSLGHREGSYVIELGSNFNVSSISPEDNFGFGETGNDANTTSYWVLNPGVGQPLGIGSTGIDTLDTQVNPPVYSRMALAQYHTPGEAIMWAQLPWTQFPLKDSLKIRIRLRRGQAPSNSVTLFTINATSIQGEPRPGYNIEERREHRNLKVEPETTPTMFVQEVTANNLNNGYLTAYDWFESNPIVIDKGKNFEFNIIWSGNADLFIDKIMVYNTTYEVLYVDQIISITEIKDTLKGRYPQATDTLLQSLYFDEPFQLSAQFRGEIQKEIRDNYSGNQNFEINSAVGGIPKHFLDFDKKYANYDEQQGTYKKYLLYDMYPIDKNTTTATSSIQHRLDLFCNYNNVGDSLGDPYDPERYKYVGLLNAQLAAQEAGIPFVMTLGVHSEQYLLNTGNGVSIIDGDHTRRPPTKDEIFAMGNLALAYGAKGFMYYMIPTRAGTPEDDVVWNTYGLFDEEGNPFDLENSSGLIQDPSAKQIPNGRFYAVKEFIQSTKLIEKTLLGLDWLSTRNWATYPSSNEWIKDVITCNPAVSFSDDPVSERYVETGFFEEKNPPAGMIEQAKFIYIVNRRCNQQELTGGGGQSSLIDNSVRGITFSLNFPNSIWNNYTVTDIKTDSMYSTTKTGTVTIYFGAGEGTLLKIEPTIQSGGTLVTNDSLGSGIYTVDTTLVVPENVKLKIEAGAKLTFNNYGKLLILDGQLEVNGTESNEVEFDFVSKNWTAANGIFAYRTPLKISNAIIKNASCGIYSHVSPGDTIDGVLIDNTHCGMSLYYSYNYGSDNTVIKNSYFQNSQLWGITMVGSKPLIYNNWFTNMTGYGISANTESAPILMDTVAKIGNNKFELAGTSIYSLNSIPVIGTTDYKDNYFGGNCFHADTVSLRAIYEGDVLIDINAYGADWEATDPSEFRIEADPNVTVWTDGYNSDCSGTWLNPNMLSGGSSSPKQMESGGDPDSIKSLIKDVKRMIAQGQLRDAHVVLTDIINGTADVRYKKSAVSLIPQCYEFVNMSELKSNLLSIRNVGGLFKFTTMLLMNIDTENMDTYKREILNAGNNKMYGAGGNSEEVMMIFNSLLEEKYKSSGLIDTVGKVTPMLTYLNSNFPTSEYTKSANLLFSEVSNNSTLGNGPMNKPQVSGTKSEGIEYDYNLYNNYPNPFNPETVIKFSLKEKSNVTLTVFNIAGQKVAELVSGEMEKGMYENPDASGQRNEVLIRCLHFPFKCAIT